MGTIQDDQHVTDRFWSLVDRSGACWRWQGYIEPAGYGRFGVNGRNEYAHRVAWELAYGPIPARMQVVGRPGCPNRDCVRPDHHELSRHSQRPHNTLDDVDALIDRAGGEDACWRWHGPVTGTGRPQIVVSGQVIRVHRFMYARANGVELAPSDRVRQRCGEPGCVNPRHLRRSQDDRPLDHPRRPWMHGRKLTVDEEQAICAAFHTDQSAVSLARQYGVSRQCIYAVWQRNGMY